ncbi:hypothetical protein ACS0TY_023609 [Phlomoides rotata]
MDSFFRRGFKAPKCKTLLKLTIPRIKLLRNRREVQIKQMRREIAKLLETGQDSTARIRVEHIIREEKMMAAQEIVELFCELITVRLPIIESQRECPLDLKEAIASICFAAPRCADLPELIQAQMLFAGKYGKEFVSTATELMPECGVNRQLVELLSIRAPAPDVKLKLLKEIAEEHELDWDPSASESELSKAHEDLLNGPTQFINGSKLPLPQHDDTKTTPSEPAANEHSVSDEEFDIIDFSEVPRQPFQSNKQPASAPEMLPFPASALTDDDDDDYEDERNDDENLSHSESGVVLVEHSVIREDAQFLPFTRPPSQSFRMREVSSSPRSAEYDNVDLQDVLAAALEAANSAERAAAAARSAASLAQLRITQLMKEKNNQISSSYTENPFHHDKPETNEVSYDDGEGDFDSSPHSTLHQPQRLPSMDQDTYLSYPNLFSSQGSNLSSRV